MRFNSKFLFFVALLILLLSGVSIILNHNGFALRLSNIAFLILALGVILYIREARKHEI